MTFHQTQHRPGFPLSRYAGPGKDNREESQEPHASSSKAKEAVHPSYHPNCPDSLNCLPDTDEKPNHILPVIVRSAILGSPKKRLTLRDIYIAIEQKFPYFRTANTGWRDSIRHNLSLNRLFVKVARPATDPGFGSYWTVDLDAPPGSKRPRKRGNPYHDEVSLEVEKYHMNPSAPAVDTSPEVPWAFKENPNRNEDQSQSDSELEIDELQSDFESEEGAEGPPQDHQEEFVPPSVATQPRPDETPEEALARLQSELAESQQQFLIASAFALRVSDQLEDAKEFASRAQTKLREAEEQLEEEIVARVEVEKKLEEEEELRKEAEEQLKALLEKGGPNVKLFDAVRSIRDISKRVLER